MQTRWICLAFALLFGCSSEQPIPPDQAYDPAKVQGQVDKTLPADDQERQAALKSVLDQLQEGNDFESLFLPGVTYEESESSFLEGAIGVASWSFDGRPSGIDVPVVLQMTMDSGELKERKRVYRVAGSSGGYTVSRAK
ncbi:MAG: hypothetical protein HYS13_11275 [Planctomycetia bacterium]|nr:hypothetical protein [Planctomycetia bacterium]